MSDPFKDEFSVQSGSTFTILADPVFVQLVEQAIALIVRSNKSITAADRIAITAEFVQRATRAAPLPAVDETEERAESVTAGEEAATEAAASGVEDVVLKKAVVVDLFEALTAAGTLEGLDREVEGFTNLALYLVSHTFSYADSTERATVSNLLLALTASLAQPSVRLINPTTALRYSAISNLFNSLPLTTASAEDFDLSSLKLTIIIKLVEFACANDDYTIIAPVLTSLESWLIEWGMSCGSHGEEEGNSAVLILAKLLVSRQQPALARTLLLSHLSTKSSVPSSAVTPSSSTSQLASLMIKLSLEEADFFDFTSLSALPALAAPSVPELAKLLEIFQSGNLAAFHTFFAAPTTAELAKTQGLDLAALERKLKLLALTELCSTRVGEYVTYQEMAAVLGLKQEIEDDGEQVEIWVIDAIRATLISGKLSQPLLAFQVSRATPRLFTADHWIALEKRLQTWQVSVRGILSSAKGETRSIEGITA